MGEAEAEAEGSSSKDKRWSLQGMTALVTGGSKGIGHAIVEELAGLGASVHTCSRTESELNNCLVEWKAKGFQVTGSTNNVGNNIGKAVSDYTAEDVSVLTSTNFESAYSMSVLAHPFLKASAAGSIVFISSVVSAMPANFTPIYGPNRAAINQLGRYLAYDWAGDNIRLNTVAPAVIKTPLAQRVKPLCFYL
ncbi:hypothetical protein V6N13_136053 [Hibiscus sabdariffa]|uniref:Uncharacterized protein n=1 Tax=Hibiscus sabdariffa TaxID=183260 RepID=A0ABR2DPS5_9ROSI